ncbi:type IV secretion system protein [Clavibacter michiganensis]|uniref:type IV secretion system protein n=1 Tax=Clavibacter michiganensis TaxID=28447 RepID=UPI00293103D1|nr:type IV secretion system protein [Clavibacter michiganensis]
MDDAVVAMLNALSEGLGGSTDDLLNSPAKYNDALWKAALTINDVGVKPVAAVVLAIMIVLMLASHASRIEGDRELGVRIIAATMFKAALVIIAVREAVLFLDAINQIGTYISSAAGQANLTAAGGDAPKLGDQARDAIKDAGTVKQLGMLVVLLLPFIVVKVVGAVATVLIFVRFLQLYMLTAFASLPITFFGHDDTKPMAIGYLKGYASTVLQGVMIVFAVIFYKSLLGGWIGGNLSYNSGDDIWNWIIGNFGSFLIAPAVLGFLLFGSQGLAKKIVGEG